VSGLGSTQRLPTESSRPMVVFAQTRLGLSVAALLALAVAGFPFGGAVGGVLAGVAIPWSLLNLYLALKRPDRALNPLIAFGDLAVLMLVEALAPETYSAVRFLALALLGVHAHFQGGRIGVVVAVCGVVGLVIPTALQGSGESGVEGDHMPFYEATFAAATLMTVALIGCFRIEESASRLRARELSRRTLQGENEIRRKLSQALHDGPVQELIGLDMTIAAANAAVSQGDEARAADLLREAGEITQRNVRSLRDEMLDLGPYAYDEISFEAAVERCLPIWQRRYDMRTHLALEPLELPSEMEGELFRITQEAVSNAGRHGQAKNVTIGLASLDGTVELSVVDDGKGFGDVDPLGASEAGHIGLASMRERAELIRGRLRIESTDAGTEVRVSVPYPRRSRIGLLPRGSR
jgi:signal transduction histidine kinase